MKGSRNQCLKRLQRRSWESRTVVCGAIQHGGARLVGYRGTFAWKHVLAAFQALFEDSRAVHYQNSSGVGKVALHSSGGRSSAGGWRYSGGAEASKQSVGASAHD